MIRVLRRGLPYAWMLVIFCVSHRPPSDLPRVDLFPHADKVIHAGVYGFLILCFAIAHAPYRHARDWLVWAVPLSLLYAVSDEYHQSFVGRCADFWDVVADAAGIAVMSALLLWRSPPPLTARSS